MKKEKFVLSKCRNEKASVTDTFVGKVYQHRRPAAGEKKKSAMDKEAGK